MLCAKFDRNWSSGSGEEVEIVKVNDKENDDDDDGQRTDLTRKAHLSLRPGELKYPQKPPNPKLLRYLITKLKSIDSI